MALDDEAQAVFKADFAFIEQHFNGARDEARFKRLHRSDQFGAAGGQCVAIDRAADKFGQTMVEHRNRNFRVILQRH